MNLRLSSLSTAQYAQDVLPLTHRLWGGVRDIATYIADNTDLATTTWGSKHFTTLGCFDGEQLIASHKLYAREVTYANTHLRAVGIGAVFTPDEFRGRGYASIMLAQSLDRSRELGFDATYLFSDIAPAFYEALGFTSLSSRAISLRADSITTPRMAVRSIEKIDALAIRACARAQDALRTSRFDRTPAWWQWVGKRLAQGSEHPSGNTVALMIGSASRAQGYVLGARLPHRDAFVLDDFGLAPEADPRIVAALLRSAAGDLHRITGWLPPNPLRSLLPRGVVHRRKSAIFMAAPLTRAGKAWIESLHIRDSGDPVWSLDHI